jgi:alpha-glucosidase (family GH31 glycosyl hydrolase)
LASHEFHWTRAAALVAVGTAASGCGGLPDAAEVSAAAAARSPDAFEVPDWAWSHWVWEDESTQQSALALVDGYLERDIPVTGVIIDSPWATGYNTFEWDAALFPRPQEMIDEFHRKGVRVLLWIVPVVNAGVEPMYSEARERGFFMQRDDSGVPAVFRWWKGEGSLLDLWNTDAVAWWKSKMDTVLAMGIDGWKLDGAEFNAYLAGVDTSPALGAKVKRLTYSHAYARLFYDYSREKLGHDRIISMRPIDSYGLNIGGDVVASGSPEINWAAWVGDQDATFSGLRAALLNIHHSAEYGYLAMGSDIGGYREEDSEPHQRKKELFLRWAQVAAFHPVMENGGGGEHRPWIFDEETEAIYRAFVKLHLRLVPYMKERAKAARAERRSLLSFQDKQTFAFLLGDDVFVAPILGEGGTLSVTFPVGGEWRWLFGDHATHGGGVTETLSFTLGTFPAFVRAGSPLAATLLP